MQNTDEEWRDIRGWEGLYQVSSLGRVRSMPRIHTRFHRHGGANTTFQFKGRILRPGRHENGYLIVALSDLTKGRKPRTFRVHRLVCEAFNGPQPSPQHEVAHNDNSRDNNVPSNLRWATHYDNLQDSVRARAGREANRPR
jgi:hypothetical protein